MPKDISKPPAKVTRKGKANPILVVNSDIFISIKGPHMDNIVSRAKNHEFRKYLIPETVERMWFYVSSPDQTLRYVATVSKGKTPGDIDSEDGIGNAEFNKGLKDAKYAYEVLHLHKLLEPLPLARLREGYHLFPPQRFTYLPRQLCEDVPWEQQEQLF
ncbi:hypothetical protein JB92DRAFT_3004774 [Gautieria morchelliformis]|nr:hypothetical protein JB92DRAFT_3004774 [Gautieria morchelliformis]